MGHRDSGLVEQVLSGLMHAVFFSNVYISASSLDWHHTRRRENESTESQTVMTKMPLGESLLRVMRVMRVRRNSERMREPHLQAKYVHNFR